jgi:hypothetical protein
MVRGVQLLHDRLRGRDLPQAFRMSPSSIQTVYDQLIRVHGNGFSPPNTLDALFAQDDVLQRLAQAHTPNQSSVQSSAPGSASNSSSSRKRKARDKKQAGSSSAEQAPSAGKAASGSGKGAKAGSATSEKDKKRGSKLMKFFKGKAKFEDVCHVFHAFGSCNGCRRSHACPLCTGSPEHSIAALPSHAPHLALFKEAEA